ncbi:hypothetical protein BC833DRAFT_602444 [Globomyces pollinis-pini]|nr:hypothetical protein BC833DRAFT_602444 [Globomyces pollinis-pini]
MIGSLRIISLILALDLVSADEHSHSYNSGDEIVVWFNTVGPKNNVQETYSYSSLNLCTSKNNYNHYHESLAEALLGQDLIHSGLDIKFLKDQRKSYFCSSTFNQVQLQKLKYAVANDYWFQSYIDNLPLWGYIGFKNSTGYFIYTHRSYQFYYNNNQIIKLQMNSTGLKELSLDLKLKMNTLDIDFTYSVKWTETEELFSDRFSNYLDSGFFEHKIHCHCCHLVIVVLMRTVKRDYQRYDYNDRILDLERDFGDETGWKLVHGDVFRRPVRFSFLSAFIGTGVQLILMSFLVLMLTAAGNLYEGQATILTASIFAFAFSSVMAGYFSGRQFARHQGNNWVGTLLLTIILLPAIICIVVSVVNTVAITYSSTKAIPFGSIVKLLLIWIFLIVPLTALGFSLGKNVNSNFRFPAKANAIPRQIPDRPW